MVTRDRLVERVVPGGLTVLPSTVPAQRFLAGGDCWNLSSATMQLRLLMPIGRRRHPHSTSHRRQQT